MGASSTAHRSGFVSEGLDPPSEPRGFLSGKLHAFGGDVELDGRQDNPARDEGAFYEQREHRVPTGIPMGQRQRWNQQDDTNDQGSEVRNEALPNPPKHGLLGEGGHCD